MKLYGPRLKLMSKDGQEFVLLLDEFDQASSTSDPSKIVTVTMPRAQLEEWTAAFQKVLAR